MASAETMTVTSYEVYDLFICHASEDKDVFVRPLAERLRERGLKVWYDEYTLMAGDSLRQRIDQGLATTRRAVLVLSPNFFQKPWVQWEMNGLVQQHLASLQSRLIPVWLNVTADDVRKYSPPLADIVGVRSTDGPKAAADAIVSVLGRKFFSNPDNAEQVLMATISLLNLGPVKKDIRLSMMVRREGKFVIEATVEFSPRSKRSLRIAERLCQSAMLGNGPILETNLAMLGGKVTPSCSRSMLVWPFAFHHRPDKWDSPYAVIGVESMKKWSEKRGLALVERMLQLSIFMRIIALPGVTME